MLQLIQPGLKELSFRKQLLSDKKTMAFNNAYGGTIPFPKEMWPYWYEEWMNDSKHYYAYVYNEQTKSYIGEVFYYYEDEYKEYILNIIIHHKYRGKGYGKQSLELLLQKAKENGLRFICDDIDDRNPMIPLFKSLGFKEVWQRDHILMLKKRL